MNTPLMALPRFEGVEEEEEEEVEEVVAAEACTFAPSSCLSFQRPVVMAMNRPASVWKSIVYSGVVDDDESEDEVVEVVVVAVEVVRGEKYECICSRWFPLAARASKPAYGSIRYAVSLLSLLSAEVSRA